MSDPAEVRRQVWHSLVSMLQVYAHAAGLHGKPYAVTTTVSSAAVKYGNASLTISFTPEEGVAVWRLIRSSSQEQGSFEIDEHGALQFPGGPKELDMAAMDWMDHLSQPEHAKL